MESHEMEDYQRLRREGRWKEANEFREAERRRLREAGCNRQQARDESWAAMVAKFPPLGQVASPPNDLDRKRIDPVNDGFVLEHNEYERRELVELAQNPEAWDDGWTAALRWANAFRNYDLTPSQAPSVLAWLLRKLCREDFRRFAILVFTDYSLCHGEQLRFEPPTNERDERLRAQLFEDLKFDDTLARLAQEDRQLEEGPTTAGGS